MIDGSEKRNGWLNFELQSPHVIERRSKQALTLPFLYKPDSVSVHLDIDYQLNNLFSCVQNTPSYAKGKIKNIK